MPKQYENLHTFYFQKKIVSAETILGTTVTQMNTLQMCIVSILPNSYLITLTAAAAVDDDDGAYMSRNDG